MNRTEITLYFEEAKAAALKAVLAQDGATIESKLQESLRFLYEQLVPVEQQTTIDALIKAQEEQERQEAEARKRFAVFHVRENGEDSYFTSQHFTSFHAAGYRYRLYTRGDLSSQPQNLAEAFAGSEAISEDQYRALKEQVPEDHRILALIDFDLDEGTVTACKLGHREMKRYDLHDVSVAAFKAFRGEYRTSREREYLFDAALEDKEIEMGGMKTDESDDAPVMQM